MPDEPKGMSKRDFLKTISVAAAATAAGFLPGCSKEESPDNFRQDLKNYVFPVYVEALLHYNNTHQTPEKAYRLSPPSHLREDELLIYNDLLSLYEKTSKGPNSDTHARDAFCKALTQMNGTKYQFSGSGSLSAGTIYPIDDISKTAILGKFAYRLVSEGEKGVGGLADLRAYCGEAGFNRITFRPESTPPVSLGKLLRDGMIIGTPPDAISLLDPWEPARIRRLDALTAKVQNRIQLESRRSSPHNAL